MRLEWACAQGNTLCAPKAGFTCVHREAICAHKENMNWHVMPEWLHAVVISCSVWNMCNKVVCLVFLGT
jgi:hypothetical protein